jgi:phosphatidylserine/phosphatidylglycerophosphate/cardiolipin synthase-like enzyme
MRAARLLLLVIAFALGWHVRPLADPPVRTSVPPTIQTYFSPNGGTRDAIVALLDGARDEILVALYTFTDPILADAIIRAHRRGVRVEMALDRTQRTARGGQAERVIAAGVPVRFDRRYRILHHKFAVIDGGLVVTGSFNWTRAAEKSNGENTVVLADRGVVERYRGVFRAL